VKCKLDAVRGKIKKFRDEGWCWRNLKAGLMGEWRVTDNKK
jgi:hypothetical protein